MLKLFLSGNLLKRFLEFSLLYKGLLAFVAAFIIVLALIPLFIRLLKTKKLGQSINIYLNSIGSHSAKAMTPTAGGVVIVLAVAIASFLVAEPFCRSVMLVIGSGILFCIIGFLDDWQKISTKDYHGLSAKMRLILEILVSVEAIWLSNRIMENPYSQGYNAKVFIGAYTIEIGILLYTCFRVFVIVSSINAVNLTDGLDGLVSMPLIHVYGFLAMIGFAIIGLIKTPNILIQQYYYCNLEEVTGLVVVCSSVVGALSAFLIFNRKPASIFMGDSGSIAMGGMMGLIACMLKVEIFLALAGFIFVIETLSVIVQVGIFKMFGKRVFKISPIHHHFEKSGFDESKVVKIFWSLSFIFVAIATVLITI